jgi:hypothetical protein
MSTIQSDYLQPWPIQSVNTGSNGNNLCLAISSYQQQQQQQQQQPQLQQQLQQQLHQQLQLQHNTVCIMVDANQHDVLLPSRLSYNFINNS